VNRISRPKPTQLEPEQIIPLEDKDF